LKLVDGLFGFQCVKLLIAPEGIEIVLSFIAKADTAVLLIAPEGIEIFQQKKLLYHFKNF